MCMENIGGANYASFQIVRYTFTFTCNNDCSKPTTITEIHLHANNNPIAVIVL